MSFSLFGLLNRDWFDKRYKKDIRHFARYSFGLKKLSTETTKWFLGNVVFCWDLLIYVLFVIHFESWCKISNSTFSPSCSLTRTTSPWLRSEDSPIWRLPDLKELFIQLDRAAKEVGLEVNEGKTNYLVVSRSKRTTHAGQNFTFGEYNFERELHYSKHKSQNLQNRTSPSCNIWPGNLHINRKERRGTGSFRA